MNWSSSSQDVLFGALEDECEDCVCLGRLPLARVQHHFVLDDGRRHGGEEEPVQRIVMIHLEDLIGVFEISKKV